MIEEENKKVDTERMFQMMKITLEMMKKKKKADDLMKKLGITDNKMPPAVDLCNTDDKEMQQDIIELIQAQVDVEETRRQGLSLLQEMGMVDEHGKKVQEETSSN